MLHDFITGLFFFASLFGFGQQSFGAFSDPFLSVQLAASPTNGDCLTTDGTNNSWDTCGAGPGGALTSYDAWTHPASGISATTSGMVFNSASSTFVGQLRAGHFFGNITGQSSTSLALAANGTNCSAGNFPLGVDASGVAESCTDAWTEAENTAAAYAAQATTLTVAGTAQQITSSAGAQSLAANRTWTLSLPSHVVFPGSINAGNSTTTNATSTSLAVLNLNSASCDVKASTAGALSCGTDAGGLSDYDAWTHPAAGISATTSQIIISASSTIGNGTAAGGLTANGNTTTTLTHIIGGWDTVPISGISSPAGMFTASTTGRSGIEMSNEGGGSAPEFRFSITSARSATDYMSFGRTNADATAGGTLVGLNKTAIGYLFDNTRDLVIGAFSTGKSLYFAAGDSSNTDAVLASTGFFGIGTTSPFAPLSVVGSGGVLAGKYTATSTGVINESAFQNISFTIGTGTSATTTSSFATTASSTNLFASAIQIANQALTVTAARVATLLGSWDFGGADSIEIVNGAAPVVNAIGETALDTTANQLLIATSTNASYPAVLPLEQPLFSITVGSTTPEFISSGTIPISRWVGKGREVTRVECYVTGGTSKVMSLTDGTNATETVTCGTTNTQDNSLDTNPTFTANELWYINFGATTGTVNYVTFTAYGYIDRE